MQEPDLFEKFIEQPDFYTLVFPVTPKAIQSVRARVVIPKRGKPFATMYQPKENEEFKNIIRGYARNQVRQLEGFKPFTGGVGLSVVYVHKFLKKHTQRQINMVMRGGTLWKTTKGDMTDNLQKGWCDALNGIVWKDDGQVCHMRDFRKIYGPEDKIMVKVWNVEQE